MGSTVPRSSLHTGHVTLIAQAEADVRRAGAMLQLAGNPEHKKSVSEGMGAHECECESPVKSNEIASLIWLEE